MLPLKKPPYRACAASEVDIYGTGFARLGNAVEINGRFEAVILG